MFSRFFHESGSTGFRSTGFGNTVLVAFRLPDQWRDPGRLQHEQQHSGGHAAGQGAPGQLSQTGHDGGRVMLVTGETEAVPRIVGGLVQGLGIGESRAEKQQHPHRGGHRGDGDAG